jgi:hypothetical protein
MKEVFKQTGNFYLGGWGHDIGPTEEDVKDMYLEVHNLDLKKLNFNVYKIIIPKEESKQETLEETAKNSGKSKCKHFRREHTKIEVYESFEEGFIAGSEWQAERMYSDEESIKKIIDYVDFQFNANGELNTEIKNWFEQFKKK